MCFNWVLDYVSMRLLSSHNAFGDHPSPSSPALALTESNTRSNVTVPDVSYPSQEVILFQLGA